MRNIRLYIFSAAAILLLVLAVGLQVSSSWRSQEQTELNMSLDQETLLMVTATQSAVSSLSYQLLDILKVEGQGRPTRTFDRSSFVAAALLEGKAGQWLVSWNSSRKSMFSKTDWSRLAAEWDINKIEPFERHIRKLGDFDGQPYFALLVPVRKPGAKPYFGVGVFSGFSFPMRFSALRQRQTLIFNQEGIAVVYSAPAYVGTSVKRMRGVADALENDELSFREEWSASNGQSGLTLGRRVPETNLYVATEGVPAGQVSFFWSFWIYLILVGALAIALNWWLFEQMVSPLFKQIRLNEDAIEKLKHHLEVNRANATNSSPSADRKVDEDSMNANKGQDIHKLDFIETPGTSLLKVAKASVRSFEDRLKALGINVEYEGLESVNLNGEGLQLQTAIEEVIKNAVEAMANAPNRKLKLRARVKNLKTHLEVIDTGEGIAKEDLNKVFDPFFSTKDSQGVARGLGLNVVRRVIEEMKGEVSVEPNSSGIGITVKMSWPLPVELSELEAIESVEEDWVQVAHTPQSENVQEFKPPMGLSLSKPAVVRRPVVRGPD